MANATKQEKIPLTPLSFLSDANPRLVSLLPTLISEYQCVTDEISTREESRDDLKLSIESLISSLPAQYRKVGIPGSWYVIRKQNTTSSLNRQKLVSECIAREVDPVLVSDILVSATESKKGKEYIQVVDDTANAEDTNSEDSPWSQ
jgi:hypothetical protein